jgi:hypothetical protein
MNETLALGVDLSNYTGDFGVTGNLTVTGTSTLNDVAFIPGAEVDRTNTTQTGTTTYDTNYDATYDGSEINYTNGTVVNQDETSIFNNSGVTNYDSTSVINNTGGTVNNTNVTENNTSTYTQISCT